MHESLTIRPCTLNDVDTIVSLGVQTFRETFDAVNTPENMNLYIDRTFSREKIRSEFDETGAVFFIVEEQQKPVGFAKVRASKKEPGLKGNLALEIERIYAVKNVIGKGVGKALMQTCLDYAKSTGYDVVWLGVWEHNARAIEFYSKWGFQKFGQHVFMLGTDAQTDILMQKKIQ
jgi:ribosomal protein S18 acetylase RimI-like enzyme